jgi:outer membrane protein OmpA-like peptidoglycan-associated protein
LRDFPVYSTEAVRVGLKWTAEGERALDPLNNGNVVIAPLYAQYEYKGIEDYNGEKVYRISANYAARYGEWRTIPSARPSARGTTQSGPVSRNNVAMTNKAIEEREPFIALSGSHAVDILIRVSDGVIMLLRDKLDETYLWSSGNTVRFSGFTLSFGKGLVPVNKLVIEKSAKLIPDTEYKNVPEGVRLVINNLNFKADSDELLDGEGTRLNSIAAALGQAKGKTFLVEGHTARSGEIETEMPLSALRAKRIVDEMVLRGIPASSFVYKGWGGTKPVGDNETSEGRAKNRRVEITILE